MAIYRVVNQHIGGSAVICWLVPDSILHASSHLPGYDERTTGSADTNGQQYVVRDGIRGLRDIERVLC